MKMQVLELVVVAMSLTLPATRAGHIYFFDGPNIFGNSVDWAFSEVQRCYSMPCFNDRARSLQFRKLPQNGHLVVYQDTGCQGKHNKIALSPNGVVKYKDGNGAFDFGISSFMIWSSGMYATNGMTDICEEHDREKLAVNSTGNSTAEARD